MESNIISASDLLKNLSEDYQSYEKDFVFCQTEKELKKAKFRLLLSIVFKEYTKAIDDIDIIDTKGQLIYKCPAGVNKSTKKTEEIFVRISALASKKRSNQKSMGSSYH